jgi:hypothetical protein
MAQISVPRYLRDLAVTLRVLPPLLLPAARRARSAGQARLMSEEATEESWRRTITGEDPRWRGMRPFFNAIPARDRCKNCCAPFTGVAGAAMRLIGHGRYNKNPRFCDY